jgi:hypothetical protein
MRGLYSYKQQIITFPLLRAAIVHLDQAEVIHHVKLWLFGVKVSYVAPCVDVAISSTYY